MNRISRYEWAIKLKKKYIQILVCQPERQAGILCNMPNDKPPQTDPGLSLGVEDIQWTLATDTPLITTRHLLLNGVEGMRKGVWWTADASAWVSQAYGFVEEAVHSGDDLDGDYGHTRKLDVPHTDM